MNSQIVQLLLDGKRPVDVKKTGDIAVKVANLLLPPPQERKPDAAILLSSVLGEAPEFTSVTQLVELGRAIRDKRLTTKAATVRSDDKGRA
jgi:hypothetical protein